MNYDRLLERANEQIALLPKDSVFVLKDLFIGTEWNELEKKYRLQFGRIFKNAIIENQIAKEKYKAALEQFNRERLAIERAEMTGVMTLEKERDQQKQLVSDLFIQLDKLGFFQRKQKYEIKARIDNERKKLGQMEERLILSRKMEKNKRETKLKEIEAKWESTKAVIDGIEEQINALENELRKDR